MERWSHRASELEGGTLEIQPSPFANQGPEAREERPVSQGATTRKLGSGYRILIAQFQMYFLSPWLVCWGLVLGWLAVSRLCVQPGALLPGAAPLPTFTLFSTPQTEQSRKPWDPSLPAQGSAPVFQSTWKSPSAPAPRACLSPRACLEFCTCRSLCLEHFSHHICTFQFFQGSGLLLNCHLLAGEARDSKSR